MFIKSEGAARDANGDEGADEERKRIGKAGASVRICCKIRVQKIRSALDYPRTPKSRVLGQSWRLLGRSWGDLEAIVRVLGAILGAVGGSSGGLGGGGGGRGRAGQGAGAGARVGRRAGGGILGRILAILGEPMASAWKPRGDQPRPKSHPNLM